MNDVIEVDLIRLAQRDFSNPRSYFIGGSTNAEHNADIKFDAYLTDNSGNSVR